MNPARNLLMTSTAVLALALAGCSGDDPAAETEPTPVSDDASTTPPPETPTDDGPTDLVGVEGPLEPGLYSMAAWGKTKQTGPLPRAIVDVPEGYFSNGGYVIDAGHDGVTDDQFGDISVWHAVQVLADPCRRGTAKDVGPTVQDLAQALVRATGPSSTQPRPVVLDGHRGVTFKVTVPPAADLSRCTFGEYSLWRTEPRGDSAFDQNTPGVVNHLWILDVDGTRLVLLATLYPDETDQLHQELIAIAESIHFEPAPS